MINTSFTYSADKTRSDDQMLEKLCTIREKIMSDPQLEWSIGNICEEFHVRTCSHR